MNSYETHKKASLFMKRTGRALDYPPLHLNMMIITFILFKAELSLLMAF